MESLLSVHGDDFELWKEDKYDMTFYHLSIEGYIGLEELHDFVGLYEIFLEELHNYLVKNDHEKTEHAGWTKVYQTRAVDIRYDGDCYWVFLDGYESTQAWDMYYYLQDVIEQIKKFNILINSM